MEKYRIKSKFFDVTIECNDLKLYFNKYVLYNNTEYFKVLFQEKFNEQDIDTITLEYDSNVVQHYLYILDYKDIGLVPTELMWYVIKLLDFTDCYFYKLTYDFIVKYLKTFNYSCVDFEHENAIIFMLVKIMHYYKSYIDTDELFRMIITKYKRIDDNKIKDKIISLGTPESIFLLAARNYETYWEYYKIYLYENPTEKNIKEFLEDKNILSILNNYPVQYKNYYKLIYEILNIVSILNNNDLKVTVFEAFKKHFKHRLSY